MNALRLVRLRMTALGLPWLPVLVGAAVAQEDLVEKGRALAEEHCIRCHVVRDDSPFSGISSTPSFRLLVTALPDWQERFETFYQRRPHPAVVRFRGFTPLSDDEPPTQTVDLVLEDVEAIVAFADRLHQKYEGEGGAVNTGEVPDPMLGSGPGPGLGGQGPGSGAGPPGAGPGPGAGSGGGPATVPDW